MKNDNECGINSILIHKVWIFYFHKGGRMIKKDTKITILDAPMDPGRDLVGVEKQYMEALSNTIWQITKCTKPDPQDVMMGIKKL